MTRTTKLVEALQALKERVEKATPGEWANTGTVRERQSGITQHTIDSPLMTIAQADSLRDAEAICAAHNDLPTLLASAIEELTVMEGALEQAVEHGGLEFVNEDYYSKGSRARVVGNHCSNRLASDTPELAAYLESIPTTESKGDHVE